MKPHATRFLAVKQWDHGSGPIFDVVIKDPSGPCDFSYGNINYYFGSMKKLDPQGDWLAIMTVCPRTNLLMSMSGREIPIIDDKGDVNWYPQSAGWHFEHPEVQRAYSGWVAEKTLFKK